MILVDIGTATDLATGSGRLIRMEGEGSGQRGHLVNLFGFSDTVLGQTNSASEARLSDKTTGEAPFQQKFDWQPKRQERGRKGGHMRVKFAGRVTSSHLNQ